MKNPAVLFYTSDFITGTMFFSDEQVGKYIRLLCMQHQKGRMTEKEMMFICKTHDIDIFSKFLKDENGLYFNKRMDEEIEKRQAYSISRSENKLGKTLKKHKKIISKSCVNHMGNENDNINEIEKKYSEKAIIIFKTISEKYLTLLDFREPLTLDQTEILCNNYDTELLKEKIIALNNAIGAKNKYNSVFSTLHLWCKKYSNNK